MTQAPPARSWSSWHVAAPVATVIAPLANDVAGAVTPVADLVGTVTAPVLEGVTPWWKSRTAGERRCPVVAGTESVIQPVLAVTGPAVAPALSAAGPVLDLCGSAAALV